MAIILRQQKPRWKNRYGVASATSEPAYPNGKIPSSIVGSDVWFWAAHLMATHSNGMSALQLSAQLHVAYRTAWLFAQTLRRSMVDPDRELLKDVVEVDQTEVPFRTKESMFDETKPRKILIIGAVEVRPRSGGRWPRPKGAKYLNTRAGRVRLAAIPDNSAKSIQTFVRANVEPGTTLLSDGHKSYLGLAEYRHDPRVVGKMAGTSPCRGSIGSSP
jgi:hypothetical protein